MADRKITDLTALAAGSQATGDLLTIVDVSEGAAADKNKKITVESLFKGIPGNVGINTASPAGTFGVDGAAFFGNQSSSGSTDGVLRIVESTSSIYLQTGTNTSTGSSAALVFSDINASNEWMRINSSGNVGIGVTSPGAKLELRDNTQALLSWGDTAAIGSLSFNGSSQPVVRALSGKSLVFETNGSSERMRIDSSGNVGIGTTSITEKLTVFSNNDTSAVDNGLAVYRSAGDDKVNINCQGGAARFISDGGSSYIPTRFGRYNGTTLVNDVTIDGSGNFGIGTSSPDRLLHLSGADTAIIRLENTDTSLTADQIIGGLEFEKRDGSGAGAGVVGGLRMYSEGAVGESAYLTLSTASSSTNNAERMRILSSGGITFNGDTAQANALDDYEEGTWTPYFTSSGVTSPFVSNLFTSYGNQNGRYTKIGRHVYLTAFLELSGTTYANGGADNQDLGIAGLPFPTDNSQTYPSISVGWFNNWSGWSAGYTPMGYIETNTSHIRMTLANTNGITRIKSNHVQTTSAGILFSVHYVT